ncbi:restriction endonuclease-like protein [Bacillus sp. FJAT-45066]|uniref:restriction endonuclease-like protein n=1 Tax=Bacillus sp. FJAT-45066 TaxID=2011010 RepID=UPI000BB6D3FD|nr:restriction endonuclease-like protein [Bacillus sp. FJAT-45066]
MIPLPLSGSVREDVELVKIETNRFSLVIKGKPYHDRYLGLQQYRNMDFHDVMKFLVTPLEHVESVKVFDIEKLELVEDGEHRPIFFENGVYTVMVSPKDGRDYSFYHENSLLRKAIDRVEVGNTYVLLGSLHFQSEIGFSTFEIREANNTLLEVTMEIFPTKLNYKEDYQALLEEVNDEIYNLAFHFLKKTYLSASTKLEGNPSPAEFFRLITVYFNSFLKAIDQIERQPHHKLIKKHEVVRGERLKNLDSTGRNYLRKNSQLLQPVHKGISIDGNQYMPIKGISSKKEITYDTHENRFVKWMMHRIVLKLGQLLDRLQPKNRRYSSPEQNEETITLVAIMKKRLERKLRSPFWSHLSLPDRMVSSLVLQLATGYRDAYQIYLTVMKGLVLHNNIYKMSVKDVATLYEYWTYLKLGQILGRKYELISQDIIKVSRDRLYVNLESNNKAERVYKHPVTNEKITLTYQKREGNLPTVVQKPDTMLSIEKKGEKYSFNYVFDAKYRIDFATEDSYYGRNYHSPGPMEDDINTMHRYRDSIVAEYDGPYERKAFGAYVLFPWNEEHIYEGHKFYKSIDKVNIGGFPFLPNATALVERFIVNLIDKSPEELQREGILPRGSLQKWKDSFEEKVFVGVVSKEEQYFHIMREACYSIEASQLKAGWQEAKYIALYITKPVGKENGILHYGKISTVNVEEDVVMFNVEVWLRLPTVIRPVGYGIARYAMTTLRTLKQAKELPELYLQTDEERMVWQTLRRVSDEIKVDLDNHYLDQANKILTLKIKEITISLNIDENIVILKSKNGEVIKDLREFRRNPSILFRVIMNEIAS